MPLSIADASTNMGFHRRSFSQQFTLTSMAMGAQMGDAKPMEKRRSKWLPMHIPWVSGEESYFAPAAPRR